METKMDMCACGHWRWKHYGTNGQCSDPHCFSCPGFTLAEHQKKRDILGEGDNSK